LLFHTCVLILALDSCSDATQPQVAPKEAMVVVVIGEGVEQVVGYLRLRFLVLEGET
jgi:uncharacterized protein YacL